MTQQIVFRNKKGLTLVEVLISLVVLLIVFLALMQTALVAIDSNMRNVLRDEAINIAEMRVEEARNLVFTFSADTLLSDAAPIAGCPTGFPANGILVEREIRNIPSFDFCTNRTVASIDAENKRVNIRVDWSWKGESFTHTISTIIRRQSA